MAPFYGSENLVPFAFDVGAIGVQVRFEPSRREDALTNRDFLRDRDPDTDGNNAQICDDFHNPIVALGNRTEGRMVHRPVEL